MYFKDNYMYVHTALKAPVSSFSSPHFSLIYSLFLLQDFIEIFMSGGIKSVTDSDNNSFIRYVYPYIYRFSPDDLMYILSLYY